MNTYEKIMRALNEKDYIVVAESPEFPCEFGTLEYMACVKIGVEINEPAEEIKTYVKDMKRFYTSAKDRPSISVKAVKLTF